MYYNIVNELYKNKEWLYNEYIILNKSLKQLSKELNISINKVIVNVRKFNIFKKKNKLDIIKENHNKDYFVNEYINNNKTSEEISKNLKCSIGSIIKILNSYNIPIKNKDSYSRVDFKGEIFGNLKVIEKDKNSKWQTWICQCNCGKITKVQTQSLKYRRVSSCGCLRKTGFKEISGTKWKEIKNSSIRRRLEFNITLQYIWDLFLKQDRKCALSGTQLCFSSKSNLRDGTASLDRIDSSKGYIEGNVQWVHKDVNFMKQESTEKEFFNWIKTIYEFKNL